MCGISGILYSDHLRKVQLESVENMIKSIIHRGPDDHGYHLDQNMGLGFRRLSIIDLHYGHQPLSNEDGTIWIVFNGEIYNFQELRKDLISRGHQFATNTDTETIVHLYEDMGASCVKKLRGMFAFAIWDSRNKTLFCARDRFGKKPFFYFQDRNQFLFGSEIKTILTQIKIPQIEVDVLDHYMAFGYTPPEKTIYENIKKLPPAHTLTIKAGSTPKIERYWDIHFEPDFSISEREWEERIIDKLKESVRLRLISDVPLGAFLSGGIDSSSVVALMSEIMDQPVKTFSIGFPEEEFNELPQARLIAQQFKTDHHEHIVQPESIDILPHLVNSYDEPFADSSAIPTYFVCKFAREHVTVALSGDGGDELFAGYHHYRKLMNVHRFHKLTGGILEKPLRVIHPLMPMGLPGNGIFYYLSRPKNNTGAYFGKWQEMERAQAYQPQIWDSISGSKGEVIKERILQNSKTSDYVSKMQELDMHTWLPEDILTKVDRASMFHSLEVRVPILDHEFAELTFQIPSSLKLKSGEGKYIFKKAMSAYLPESILNQPKKGFGVPLKKWFKKDLKDYLMQSIRSVDSPLSAYIRPQFVESLLNQHEKGLRDLNHKIWSLVFLNEWLNQQKKEKTLITVTRN